TPGRARGLRDRLAQRLVALLLAADAVLLAEPFDPNGHFALQPICSWAVVISPSEIHCQTGKLLSACPARYSCHAARVAPGSSQSRPQPASAASIWLSAQPANGPRSHSPWGVCTGRLRASRTPLGKHRSA